MLDPSALFSKIVGHRRGGFCYELNGLFGTLLRSLGFAVQLLSARVWEDGRRGPDFDHMLLLLPELDRIADVGFGDCFHDPPALAPVEWSERERHHFRLEREDEVWILWQRLGVEDWKPQFSFLAVPRELREFEPMCAYHQSAPDSSLVRRVVASRATPTGRVTYSDGRFIETTEGLRTERRIADPQKLGVLLREQFGLELGAHAGLSRLLPPEAPKARA